MRNRRFATRRDELAADNLGTILTRREYHADSCFTLALWPRGAAVRWTLDELENALRKPAYVPFAGRKACALMLPMDPRIVEADDVFEAFARRDALIAGDSRIAEFLRQRHLDPRPHTVFLDAEARGDRGPARIEKRRDALLDREARGDRRSQRLTGKTMSRLRLNIALAERSSRPSARCAAPRSEDSR